MAYTRRELLGTFSTAALATAFASPSRPASAQVKFSSGTSAPKLRVPANAVIGVTRGAVELLTRDELQGVLAHEFSHILNGDMALNVRLIGLLHGIVALSTIGRQLATPRRANNAFGRRVRKGDAVPMAIGAVVWALGAIGVFFARLIKASVSRERRPIAACTRPSACSAIWDFATS